MKTASLVCVFLGATAFLFGQFRAGVEGTITDTSGAAVPGASVTLENTQTGSAQKTTTNGSGYYNFSFLPPGSYNITANKQGFNAATLSNVAVSAEQVQGVNLTLAPGAVSQTVTVTGNISPAFQTETASISSHITSQQITQLPQIGRDPYELLRLAPGVFGDGQRTGSGNAVNLPNTTGPGGSNNSIFQVENQVPVVANGQRLSENNYTVDGVSANSLSWGGASVITPNPQSVEQMRVSSTSYSAEDGRNSGAQINVITKSGTNKFHGSGEFLAQRPGLDAYNAWGGPFGAAPTRVNERYNQFGGALGGPIKKNKLFFFFSYEGIRDNSVNVGNGFIATPEFIQSVTQQRPDSVTAKIFGQTGIAPRTMQTISVPCPSGAKPGTCQQVNGGLDIGSLTGGTGQYVDVTKNPAGGGLDGIPDIEFAQFALPQINSGNQYNFRADYQLDPKDRFTVSSYITKLHTSGTDAATGGEPISDLVNRPLNTTGMITYNRVLSPSMLNIARFNFTRYAFNQVEASSSTNFGVPRLDVQDLLNRTVSDVQFGAPQGNTTPAVFAENTFEFSDTVSKIAGNHDLRFGTQIIRDQDNNDLLGGARPVYSFDGLWNLANDAPIYEGINANPATGAPADAQTYLRTGDYALFLQDGWKARQDLTLTLGLRWEYFSPMTIAHGLMSNLQLGPAGQPLAGAKVVQLKRLYDPDYHNWGPRFGFAFNPAADKNLVVRGGFGIYENRIPDTMFSNTATDPPDFATYGLCCGSPSSPFAAGQILYTMGASRSPLSYPVNTSALAVGIDPTTGGPNGRQVQIWGAQPNMMNPYVYVYSFDLEYNLPDHWVASLGYQGSAGHHLIRLVPQQYLYVNKTLTTTPTGPAPAFTPIYFPQPDTNSNYNALNVSANRTFSKGFQLSLKYTYGKSLDELSYEGPGAVTNQTYPQDLKSEYGPSDYDVTHYVTLEGIYALPFYRSQHGLAGKILGGWQLTGIMTAHTGFPWTVKTGHSVPTPGGPTLAPTRPVGYCNCVQQNLTNYAFMNPGVMFPGGGSEYFDFTASGPPGVGRNSFRGPRFFSTDASFQKHILLPTALHLGENAALDLQANFFNLFNQLNLLPLGFFSPGTFADNNAFFGVADGAGAGRVIQLQARFSF
ncbi:MAG TPA: carboxypeptidase regulatory-like domain-containing protein [Terriglobia bacterium]|nr:carboxypeptidase regulatory-like domain-containing protein [Terriglobia bacterium]